jgi:hypothetical protein
MSEEKSAMLPEWLFVVEVEHVDSDVVDEWDSWYDDIHLPEIVKCPGFVRGARYVGERSSYDEGDTWLTAYELTGPDALTSEEFLKRRGWGPFEGAVKARVRLMRRRGEERRG